jgi:hypothetical protein
MQGGRKASASTAIDRSVLGSADAGLSERIWFLSTVRITETVMGSVLDEGQEDTGLAIQQPDDILSG